MFGPSWISALKNVGRQAIRSVLLGFMLIGLAAYGGAVLTHLKVPGATSNPLDALMKPYQQSYERLKSKVAALTWLSNCVGYSQANGEPLMACNNAYLSREGSQEEVRSHVDQSLAGTPVK